MTDEPGRYSPANVWPWIIETQHGVYPIGTWGFVTSVETKKDVLLLLSRSVHAADRAYNNVTGEIIYAHPDEEQPT